MPGHPQLRPLPGARAVQGLAEVLPEGKRHDRPHFAGRDEVRDRGEGRKLLPNLLLFYFFKKNDFMI